MTRHRFDPLSFIFGLLFAAVAAVALIGVEVVALRDLAWIAPSLLVVAGAVLLFSSASRSRPERTEAVEASAPAPPTDAGRPEPDPASRASDAPEMGRTSEDR